MSAFLEMLERGATAQAAAAAAGHDSEMAQIMAEHYARAGLIQLPATCPSCAVESRGPGCAGCPFAR